MAQGLTGSGFTAIRVGQLSDGVTQGTPITYMERGTVTVSPASISTGVTGDTSISLANAKLGDSVVLNPLAAGLQSGLSVAGAWVSANGTVKVRIYNSTGGSLTPTSGSWSYMLFRS